MCVLLPLVAEIPGDDGEHFSFYCCPGVVFYGGVDLSFQCQLGEGGGDDGLVFVYQIGESYVLSSI